MTRNPGEAHFTIEDLRAAVETRNTAVTRKILYFGRSLRGSPQYWFATKCNLSAMITQLGKPQLFVALTLADSQDPLLDRFVPEDVPRSHAINKYRGFTASYASFKFNTVFDRFMKPYFGISDFFVRSERQHRGSQHWHGLLWLDDAPDTETPTEIAAFVDCWVSCVNTAVAPGEVPDDQFIYAAPSANYQPAAMLLSAVENRVEDLKILLQHVQRHKRHTGYCLRVRVGEANSTMTTVAVTQGSNTVVLGSPKRNVRRQV